MEYRLLLPRPGVATDRTERLAGFGDASGRAGDPIEAVAVPGRRAG